MAHRAPQKITFSPDSGTPRTAKVLIFYRTEAHRAPQKYYFLPDSGTPHTTKILLFYRTVAHCAPKQFCPGVFFITVLHKHIYMLTPYYDITFYPAVTHRTPQKYNVFHMAFIYLEYSHSIM